MGVQNTSTAGKPNRTMNKEATKVLHTQGEWTAEDNNIFCDDIRIAIAEPSYRPSGKGTSIKESEANARLCASAPSMLQTLQEILEVYQNKYDNGTGLTIFESVIVASIKTAIEKATKI